MFAEDLSYRDNVIKTGFDIYLFLNKDRGAYRQITWDPLSLNIFIGVIYRYIFIFFNRFIKMRYLCPIIMIKSEETANVFY